MLQSIIIGSGSYIPKRIVKNEEFKNHTFFDESRNRIERPTEEIIEKFQNITEISERRWVDNDKISNSDIASEAAQKAIEDAKIDKETLDYVLVAHNFGNVNTKSFQTSIMPSMAALVKHNLKIKNNQCRPYDVNFGCPGWIEAMIIADQFLKAGVAKNILVIGSETLSRVVDLYDRNSMIFADGAAAVVLQAKETDKNIGILGHTTISDNVEEVFYLHTDSSLNPEVKDSETFIRMKGRKIYEYALRNVPLVAKKVIDITGLSIHDVKKILIHQANAKMDHAMVERLFKLYDIPASEIPNGIAPMTIQKFGNSSVATIPTLFDLIAKGQFEGQKFTSGDCIVFASVGAGMNINALVYKMP